MHDNHDLFDTNTIYHVTNRGVRKEPIFYNMIDKYRFMIILAETHSKFKFKIHAYCLMGNHFHFLIQLSDSPLSKIMQSMQQRYAIYFNRTYHSQGHVFQANYYSRTVGNSNDFLNVSKYIHMNPVAAGLVTNPQDYQWSSYATFSNHSPRNHPLIDTETTYSCYPNNSRELYKKFVEKQS